MIWIQNYWIGAKQRSLTHSLTFFLKSLTNGLNFMHRKWHTGTNTCKSAENRRRSNLELLPVINVKSHSYQLPVPSSYLVRIYYLLFIYLPSSKTNIFQNKLIYCRHFRTYSRYAMFDWSDTVFRRRNVTRRRISNTVLQPRYWGREADSPWGLPIEKA
jgi:hypothetical protein